jgi:hypothetical protein
MKKLQPLRIPMGWNIAYNNWFECDASDSDSDDHLVEDLYQIYHEKLDLLLDVGWYGSVADGQFGAILLQHDFRGEELATFNSRNRQEIVSVVEEWLQNPVEPTSGNKQIQ